MNSDEMKTLVVCIGIVCLTIYGAIALFHNLNSTITATIIGAITFVIGLFFGIKVGAKE